MHVTSQLRTALQSSVPSSASSTEDASGPHLFPNPNAPSAPDKRMTENRPQTRVAYDHAEYQQYLGTLPQHLPQQASDPYIQQGGYQTVTSQGTDSYGAHATQAPSYPSSALDPWPSNDARNAPRATSAQSSTLKAPFIPLLRRIFPGIWPQPSTFVHTRRAIAHPASTGQPAPASSPSAPQASIPYSPQSSNGRSHTSNPSVSTGISNFQYLITGGCLLLALALMSDVQAWFPQAEVKDICQEVVQPNAILSRDHLAKLLAVSERTAKTAIQQVVAEPYCRLPSVSIRAGVTAEREVYPLAFDPDTWLVVLYEGDEYAGFDFSFRK